MLKKTQSKESNIFYGDLIKLLLNKERFNDYNSEDLLKFLPNFVILGGSIQESIIEVIGNYFPKYFFENKIDFKFNTWAFKKLLNIITRNKSIVLSCYETKIST